MKRVKFRAYANGTSFAHWCRGNGIPMLWYFVTVRNHQKWRYWGGKVISTSPDTDIPYSRTYMVREIDFPIVKLYLGDAELIYEKS